MSLYDSMVARQKRKIVAFVLVFFHRGYSEMVEDEVKGIRACFVLEVGRIQNGADVNHVFYHPLLRVLSQTNVCPSLPVCVCRCMCVCICAFACVSILMVGHSAIRNTELQLL